MTAAVAYGYAHDITDVEAAKPLALAQLKQRIQEKGWIFTIGSTMSQQRLPNLPDHEIDESKIEWQTYRHGGLNLQATYYFEHPGVPA